MSTDLAHRAKTIDFGVLDLDAGGRLQGFREKPVRLLRQHGRLRRQPALLEFIPTGELLASTT